MQGHHSLPDDSLATKLQSIDQDILDNAKRKVSDPGLIARVFDDFPCLLPMPLIDKLSASFKFILQQTPMEAILKTDDGFVLSNEKTRASIISWENTIIRIACAELLNNKGQIKAEIMHLLQWEKSFSREEIRSIVWAYVGSVNQVIISNYQGELPTIFSAVLDFITKNYGQWVTAELEKFNPKATRTPYDHLPVSGWVGVGLLALGVGVVAYSRHSASQYPRACSKKELPEPPRKNQF